jgi:nucleotide-sensitive chloride channel 1A
MSFEVLEEAPARDSLTPLSEFQAETPATFFGERPVLHFQSSAKILISKADLEANEIFQKLEKSSQFDWTNESGPSDETAIPEVSVWALST